MLTPNRADSRSRVRGPPDCSIYCLTESYRALSRPGAAGPGRQDSASIYSISSRRADSSRGVGRRRRSHTPMRSSRRLWKGGGLFQADEAGNIEAQLWQEIPPHQPPFRRGQGVPVLEIDVHPVAVRGELQVEMDGRLGKDAGGVDHRQAVPLVGAEEDDAPPGRRRRSSPSTV